MRQGARLSEPGARADALWRRLCSWSSGRNTLTLLVLVLAFNLFLMGAMVGASGELPIDLRLFYTPQTVQALAEGYAAGGQIGRRIAVYLLIDTSFPLLCSTFFIFALTWSLQRGPCVRQRAAPRLLLMPITGLVFDLAENLGMVATLLAHPKPLPALAWAMSAFTALKWLFVLLSVLSLLTLLALAAAQRLKSTGRGV